MPPGERTDGDTGPDTSADLPCAHAAGDEGNAPDIQPTNAGSLAAADDVRRALHSMTCWQRAAGRLALFRSAPAASGPLATASPARPYESDSWDGTDWQWTAPASVGTANPPGRQWTSSDHLPAVHGAATLGSSSPGHQLVRLMVTARRLRDGRSLPGPAGRRGDGETGAREERHSSEGDPTGRSRPLQMPRHAQEGSACARAGLDGGGGPADSGGDTMPRALHRNTRLNSVPSH
jgi:hypothetical protein